MPSSHSIIAEYVCLLLWLSKSVLKNITDADDPYELIAVLDRHMANTPDCHQLHYIGNAIVRRADRGAREKPQICLTLPAPLFKFLLK
jgi:hypothetical protein